jgi:hypothetical protein
MAGLIVGPSAATGRRQLPYNTGHTARSDYDPAGIYGVVSPLEDYREPPPTMRQEYRYSRYGKKFCLFTGCIKNRKKIRQKSTNSSKTENVLKIEKIDKFAKN